jgi:hypothetical protein
MYCILLASVDLMELKRTDLDVTSLQRDINKQLRGENGGVA